LINLFQIILLFPNVVHALLFTFFLQRNMDLFRSELRAHACAVRRNAQRTADFAARVTDHFDVSNPRQLGWIRP
jgi:hypothetical protein